MRGGAIALEVGHDPAVDKHIARLAADDILGQLLERRGRMAQLCSEAGEPKLDWVDGIERALDNDDALAAVEEEAADLLRRGVRHLVWAGMGGSIQAVRVLVGKGLFGTPLSIHPCDSTDPASLNRILLEIASTENVRRERLRAAIPKLLERSAMVGVAMGMTSEEPITHLAWFSELLREHGLDESAHIEVMTLPGSYLDRFAESRGARRVPLQLDGRTGTAGRMSAPATRVFLRPAALALLRGARSRDADGARLRDLLERIQRLYGLERNLDARARAAFVRRNPFIRLGAWIAHQARAGRNHVALETGDVSRGLEPWIEQLVEECLGKGGKGFCVFYGDQPWRSLESRPRIVAVGGRTKGDARLRLPRAHSGVERLALTGALFAGFELTVATFAYLEDIVFAGQPAVEGYKSYARRYRDSPGTIFDGAAKGRARSGSVTLDAGSLERSGLVSRERLEREVRSFGGDRSDAADVLAAILSIARTEGPGGGPLRYLDLTYNGLVTAPIESVLERARRRLAHARLKAPCKIRTGPADYHSTEQSEVDGPNELVSLRIVALEHESALAGAYPDTFLLAQARGTWQAMEDARRWVVMLTLPRLDSSSVRDLDRLFRKAAGRL